MPRKSTRNSAKFTPDAKIETRKSTRSSSRRKKSPAKEFEDEPNEGLNISHNSDSTIENEQTDKIVVDSDKVTEETVSNDISNEGSHTPPHSGSAVKEASDNDEVDAEKGKFKGISNTQVEENSEIKMNSVVSVSPEEANNENENTSEDIIPQTNDSNNLHTPQIIDTNSVECDSDVKIADSQETKTSDTENEKCDDNNHDNQIMNGDQTSTEAVKTADDDQAEEGEITESKSDEEDKSGKPEEVKAKPPIKVKLRRDSFFESTEEPQPKKMNWNPEQHQCLKIIFSDVHKLAIDDFKTLTPDLKLAAVEEIKLEETYKPKAVVERMSSRTSVDSEKVTDVVIDEQEDSNIIALNRKISIVDDAASKLKPPPSPAKQPVSSILFITNLVRPFTLKQLKELLERTGTIKEDGFWTDRIKSKCYVHYESVEEAEATRNALHGVNWPIGNGKKLIIDYATEEDMEKAKNPPVVQPPPAPEPQATPPPKTPQKENEKPVQPDPRNGQEKEERKRRISEKEREKSRPAPTREWDIGKNSHKERSRSRSRERRRKHSRRSITPLEDFIARKQRKLEESVPQKLMDDLFQRTRTMPCVYWQPLSPEEISIKQQQRLTRMEEHKRRLEENSRNRGQREPGRGAYRRRYD